MDDFAKLVALIGGILTILGVVVAITRHLTKVQEQAARDAVAAENRDLAAKLRETEARRDQLLEQISVASRAGSAVLSQKAEIDAELRSLMAAAGASGASLYVPVRSPQGQVQGLAFLGIEPFTNETQQLKSKIIPLKSLAGQCFTTGESFRRVNVAASADHFKPADRIVNFQPSTMMNLALKSGDEVVGVLQLLRREGEEGFTDEDLRRVKLTSEAIAGLTGAISKEAGLMRLLGLDEASLGAEGSVLFFDLSSSSMLFEELSASIALHLLNDYFERMCEAAFRQGGTLDNYMGDGGLIRFNVPKPQPEHEQAAVLAALEMRRAYDEMRDYWTAISPRFALMNSRIGISSGPLLRASLGHSQVQSLTVIGYPISVAAALCASGPRDRSAVVISEETWKAVKGRVIAEPVGRERLGKAARFTTAAYEVTGLR